MTKLIISVPTKEKWRKVVQKLLDEGCVWESEDREIKEELFMKNISIYIHNDKLTWSCSDYEKFPDYKFLTAQEFLGKEREFKVGDRVECAQEYNGVIKVGMKGKIIDIKEKDIGVEWENFFEGHECSYSDNECKESQGYWIEEKNIKLLKDPKCEEIITNDNIIEYLNNARQALLANSIYPLYSTSHFPCDNVNGNYQDNLPHEGKITKMRNYLKRKLSANKKVLYEQNYINDNLSLTEEGEELLMDILADKYEKEMVEIAKEEKEEEE